MTLVEENIAYADQLSHIIKKKLPRFVDIDEIKSAAYLGLVEAGSRYDVNSGVKFKTFAYLRIIGAIYDYLRERRHKVPVQSIESDVEAKKQDDCEECFAALTSKTDSRTRDVLHYYFIDEYSMREVSEKFGVSESRISQIIKNSKEKIRQQWVSETQLAA